MKRKIKRLWNGFASLRDYEVQKALDKKESIVLYLPSGDKMTLNEDRLRTGLTLTPRPHESKFNPQQKYKLIDFIWRSDE